MKLLVITQAVDKDDQALGFFHDWLREFSKRAEKLTVICLTKGKYELPANVEVLSLGKEEGVSKFTYLLRFYRYIFSKRNDYDSVFVHMNPEYVVLGGIFFRMMGKKIVLWYTHRQVNLKLRIATVFSNTILTAAKESFRIPTAKLRVIGHGIDTERFGAVFAEGRIFGDPLRLMSVGRITPIKNLDTFIEAVSFLVNDGISVIVHIVGAPAVKEDELHLESLRELVLKLHLEKIVFFDGKVPNEDMPEKYAQSDISVNLTPTGGIDKAVLESMVAGAVPLTSNTAFKAYFRGDSGRLLFKEKDAADLVLHIKDLLSYGQIASLRKKLHDIAVEEGSTTLIVEKIFSFL